MPPYGDIDLISILSTNLSMKVPRGSFVERFVGKFCGMCALNLSRQKNIVVATQVPQLGEVL